MSGFTSGMRSSASDEWTTPKWLFDELDSEFHFTLDAASTHENALCEMHYTAEDDGLAQPWEDEHVFCNPPYSQVKHWVRKAAETRGGVLSALSSRPGPTPAIGTSTSRARRPRSGSSRAASSSGTARTRPRSRPRSSCTTVERRDGGLFEGKPCQFQHQLMRQEKK